MSIIGGFLLPFTVTFKVGSVLLLCFFALYFFIANSYHDGKLNIFITKFLQQIFLFFRFIYSIQYTIFLELGEILIPRPIIYF